MRGWQATRRAPASRSAKGAIPALGFSGFENLVGAATADDWFDLRDGAALTGTIDGQGGNDSLDYRDYTTTVQDADVLTFPLGNGTVRFGDLLNRRDVSNVAVGLAYDYRGVSVSPHQDLDKTSAASHCLTVNLRLY